jgi:hypothetical protein
VNQFGLNWISISSPLLDSPSWAKASSLSRLHDHTQRHHARCDSSGRVISLTLRPRSEKTQHSRETDNHASGRNRTRNPRMRAAINPRLRLCDCWDWHLIIIIIIIGLYSPLVAFLHAHLTGIWGSVQVALFLTLSLPFYDKLVELSNTFLDVLQLLTAFQWILMPPLRPTLLSTSSSFGWCEARQKSTKFK